MRRAERRKQRREQQERQRSRERPRSFPWFTALVVAVVAVFALLGLKAVGAFDAFPNTSAPPTGSSINLSSIQANPGQKQADQGREHLNPGQSFTAYNSIPPTSGPHDPTPLRPGVYGTTQRDENMVHSLEHGYVLIAYNGISDADLAKIKDIYTRLPVDEQFKEKKLIIEPYPKLGQGEIAVAAWNYLDKMTGYDEARILGFIKAHIGQGPEPGAA
jgi:hypothetical protein